MKAYAILKGKHGCKDKKRWIDNVISYKTFTIHTIGNKEQAKNYSGYQLRKFKKYAPDTIIFVRK